MALYLGSSGKRIVILDGVVYRLNLFSNTALTNGARLLSLDNYILKGSDGMYLTVNKEIIDKESE